MFEVSPSDCRLTADLLQVHLETATKAATKLREGHGVSVDFDRKRCHIRRYESMQ
jgi:hypothetical protein